MKETRFVLTCLVFAMQHLLCLTFANNDECKASENWCSRFSREYEPANCHCCQHTYKCSLLGCCNCYEGREQVLFGYTGTSCTACGPGKYGTGVPLPTTSLTQIHTVASGCINCPVGKYTESLYSNTCTSCPKLVGQFSTILSENYFNSRSTTIGTGTASQDGCICGRDSNGLQLVQVTLPVSTLPVGTRVL
jgi:hypothetical protein